MIPLEKNKKRKNNMKNKMQLFQSQGIRTVWDENIEEWYLSVVDVVAALTDSVNPTDYLKKMRKRDAILHDYIGTNCPQVNMSTELSKTHNPKDLTENKDVAKRGGKIAVDARKSIEAQSGRSVISAKNAKELRRAGDNLVEKIGNIDFSFKLKTTKKIEGK
jgi:hypothetical protein